MKVCILTAALIAAAVSKSTKQTFPAMQMITPQPRDEYKLLTTPSQGGFCSNTVKGFTHFEGIANGRSLVGWKVTQHSPRGNCTIRIGDSPNEADMQPLRPLDGSADEKHVFPCGRQESVFEAKEVRIPRDLSCDSCIIEVQWHTEKGKQSFCSDIQVTGGEIQECPGICLNGGICSNGICKCVDSYEGSQCQNKKEVITLEKGSGPDWGLEIDIDWQGLGFYLGMIVAIVVLFVVSYFLFQYTKRKIDEDAEQRRRRQGEDRNTDMITSQAQNKPEGESKFQADLFDE